MSQGTWWIVACSGQDQQRETTYSILKGRMSPTCDDTAVFEVPLNLKFGSLDQLIRLVDDLAKQDTQCEGVLRRLERQALEIDPTSEFRVVCMRNTMSAADYITRFSWDDSKYPRSRQLRDNIDALHMSVLKLDDEVRIKTAAFNEIKSAHSAISKKESSNYVLRDLTDVITPGNVDVSVFVQTEHLTTLLVVVPRSQEKDWSNSYESLTEFVVPRSSGKLLTPDNDGNTLWHVTVFKSVVEAFKTASRAKKFTVRDFSYSEEIYDNTMKKRSRLEAEKTKQESHLLRICRAAFSDVFMAWVHLKAMRLFVEAVLRYGVPPQFSAFFIKLKANTKEKKLRKELDDIFTMNHSFGNNYIGKEMASGSDAPGMESEELYKYVWLSLTPFALAVEK